jgi:hypothetical protein
MQRKSKDMTAVLTLKTSTTKDREGAALTQMRYSRCSWAAEWEEAWEEAVVDKDLEDTLSRVEAVAEVSLFEEFTVYWLKNN